MCRIAGIVDAIRYQDQLKEDVELMISKMIHGGPDGRGLFMGKTFAIGHCRLSFLDLSDAAAQPMVNDDQSLCIAFNGEVYNFNEIKSELINKGHKFRTSSDTEVVLLAYKEWGTSSFSKLNGMYAFALYDAQLGRIYLVRDPNGIKPLYYSTSNHQLIFASELKAFESFVTDENTYWRTLFLAYGHIPEPHTKYKDVYALPKSSYLEYDIQTKKSTINRFSYQSIYSVTSTVENIHEVLLASVKRHLISDAPIGLFLSGGIDSSILTLLAAKLNTDLHTLSIYFNEGEYSEKYYQDIIADKTKSDHHALLLTKNDFQDNIEHILQSYDSPSNDGVNTWFISKYAKENKLKAVLSGLGADELFGGYPSFNRVNQLKKLHQYKKSILALSSLLPQKWERLSFLKLEESVSDYLLLRGFYSANKISSILSLSEKEVINQLNEYAPLNAKSIHSLGDVSDIEVGMYMQNQLLKDSDYMSMQHGIEIRVPFLDNEFLQLVHKLPEQMRFPVHGKKKTLIDAFVNELPKEIYDRPKKGFQFPFKEWLCDSDLIREKMNTPEKQKEYKSFLNGNIHWSKVWALTQL